MPYDLYPAVDATYNFPPEVRAALAASLDLRNTAPPMTTTQRNNLSGAQLWDGRLILNTTTDRINRYDLGTTQWLAIADASEVAAAIIASVAGDAVERTLGGIRNRVINGAFRINQRAAVSGVYLNSGDYFFDRWQCTAAGSPTWPAGGIESNLITLPSGVQIAQTIEQANMPAGRYVVSHAGTAKGRMYNVGGSVPAFVACPFVVDVDNAADVIVEFFADGGSSKTVSKVQVEQIGAAGTSAHFTPFERRPIGMELALCQRYYWRITPAPGEWIAVATCISSLTARFTLRFPVPMRTVPPAIGYSNLTHFYITADAAVNVALTAITRFSAGVDNMTIAFVGTTLTSRQALYATRSAVAGPGWLEFNAEF